MFNSLKPLFEFRGVEFRIHPSFWVGLVYLFWAFGGFRGDSESAIYSLVIALGIFLSILLHEIGHAWAARSYGYEILNLTLWLMGGFVQPAKQVHSFSHRLIFLIAGPAVNFILGVSGFAALEILPRAYGSDWGWSMLAAIGLLDSPLPNPERLIYSFSYINLALTAFNLLPIFPLDGGQILQTLGQKLFGDKIADWILLVLGGVLLLGLCVYCIINSLWLGLGQTLLIGMFLFKSNPQAKMLTWRWQIKKKGLDYYAFYVQQDYDQALEYLQQNDKLDPDRLNMRGNIFAHKQNFAAAIQDFSHIIDDPSASNEGHFWGYNNRGWVYDRCAEFAQAVSDLEKALELVPNQPTALINLSRILISQKQYDQARIRVDQLADQPLFFLFSSLLHYRAGQLKEARRDAHAFFPDHWPLLTIWSKEDMFLLVRDQLDWAQQVAAWGEKAEWSLSSSHTLLAYALWGQAEYQASIDVFDQLLAKVGSIKEEPHAEWLIMAFSLEQAGVAQDAQMFDYARSKYHWVLERKPPIEHQRSIQNELLKIDQATQTTA